MVATVLVQQYTCCEGEQSQWLLLPAYYIILTDFLYLPGDLVWGTGSRNLGLDLGNSDVGLGLGERPS